MRIAFCAAFLLAGARLASGDDGLVERFPVTLKSVAVHDANSAGYAAGIRPVTLGLEGRLDVPGFTGTVSEHFDQVSVWQSRGVFFLMPVGRHRDELVAAESLEQLKSGTVTELLGWIGADSHIRLRSGWEFRWTLVRYRDESWERLIATLPGGLGTDHWDLVVAPQDLPK